MEEYHEKERKIEYQLGELRKKIRALEKEKMKVISEKQQYCSKHPGHDYVTEIETGPYGERYTYCKICYKDY